MNKNITITTKKTKGQEWGSFLFVIFLALIVRIFIMELFFVPSTSMQATILKNEYIVSTKYSYGYSNYSLPFSPNILKGRIFSSSPKRGDIIVFRPLNDMNVRYIKRLIGLPGDKIQIINNLIYINDHAIIRDKVGIFTNEKGQKYTQYKEILPNGVSYYSYKRQQNELINNKYSNTEIFYIPKDKYFFLGDNRDESNDSRVNLGFVPFENFIAKAQFIIFSTQYKLWENNIGIIEQIFRISTWLSSIRFNRIFKSLNRIDE